MASLRGASAFVTGGGSGIGRAICVDLAKHGCHVTVADVSDAGARATADLAGPNATPVYCDVASSASQEAAFADHIRRNGGLDIAVLNAGIPERGDLLSAQDDSWRPTLDIDLGAVLDGIRLASQAMAPAGGRREGRQGVLITVASAGGFFSMPFSPVYAAAKAGVVHATRSVAKPLLERNIRICALCPEFVDTPLVAEARAQSGPQSPFYRATAGTLLTADKVAEAAHVLITDPNRVGQCLVLRMTGEWMEAVPPSQTLQYIPRPATSTSPIVPAWREWATQGLAGGRTTRTVMIRRLSNDFRAATRLETRPVPAPGPGQVLLRTVYAGINASDINYTSGKYHASTAAAEAQLPFPSGFEAVSVVAEVGPGVKHPRPGQAVATMVSGSFSDYTLVPARACLDVPGPSPEYVALLTSGLTASIGLQECGRLRKGETVLITAAAGGAGQFAVQLAKLAGCHVIATVGSEDKARLIRSLGADRAVNYRTEDLKAVLRAEYPRGVDVVWESVGGEWFGTCLNALAQKGRLIVIGAMSQYKGPDGWKPMPHRGLPEKVLNKSTTVTGFLLLHYTHEFRRHLALLISLYSAGKLKIILDSPEHVGIKAVPAAVDRLQSGQSSGKVRRGCQGIGTAVPSDHLADRLAGSDTGTAPGMGMSSTLGDMLDAGVRAHQRGPPAAGGSQAVMLLAST
uniref:Enoyl reductase (ER) domain-containing protein n=1 Tax=Auxenochlorella protothecoides TaxID=3075 RepID=A0A1D2A4L5_AUXPR